MANNIIQTVLDGATDIFGATGLNNIRNCLCAIAATRVGTVPLYRHFGTDWEWIDRPEPYAMARYRADLIEAIELYEPRVEVISISFKADADNGMNGKIYPVVNFKLADGAEL